MTFPSGPKQSRPSNYRELYGPSVVSFRVDENLEGWPLKKALRNDEFKAGLVHALKVLGLRGVKYVQEQLYPGHGYDTGYYRSKISLRGNVRNSLRQTVWDRGVYYGPWLEFGNRLNTRWAQSRTFPGYNMFKNAATKVRKDFDKVVVPILNKAVGKSNGRISVN